MMTALIMSLIPFSDNILLDNDIADKDSFVDYLNELK